MSRSSLYPEQRLRRRVMALALEVGVNPAQVVSRPLPDKWGSCAPDGVVTLFDHVLTAQLKDRSLAHVLAGADIAWFTGLSARTVAAFQPLLEHGHRAGIVRPAVDVDDVMLAFSMASGAMIDHARGGRELKTDRLRTMLHQALFTT